MKIIKNLGVGLVSLGMVAGITGGFTSALPGGNYGHWFHHNSDLTSISTEVEVENDNEVEFMNVTRQFALTGEVEVEDNTTATGVGSGDAENGAELGAVVAITNTASSVAALTPMEVVDDMNFDIDDGDVLGTTVISETEVEVENDNEIDVMNIVRQTAMSGEVEVSGNTSAGSAISGNASNSNSVTMEFRITN